MRPATRLVARLALAGAASVAALALAEGLVRVVAPQPFVTGEIRWEEHPTLGFRAQPDCDLPGELGGHINALGIRGPDLPAKRPDEHRVLVVGDSFTYGAGVPQHEAFPVHLTTELRARDDLTADGRVPVAVNAGTVGYGTVRELAWLEAYGDATQPDEVLLAFFVGNDIGDNASDRAPRIVDGQRIRGEPEESEWVLRLRAWRGRSHLYRLWRKHTWDGRGQHRPGEHVLRGRPAAVDRGLGDRLAIYARPGEEPPRERERLATGRRATKRALDGVLAWCRERGLPLKVVVIPDILQVEGDVVAVLGETFPGLASEDVDPERPQSEVVAWCEAAGVPVLDLLAPFRARTEQGGSSLHLGYDPHWNEEGHRFAAQLIARRLWPAE